MNVVKRSRMRAALALVSAIALVAVACGGSEDDGEQSVEDFYSGNTITLLIGFDTGGGYDIYGRLIADHWGRFIPGNPNIIVENLEGGRGDVAANRAYSSGPHDGSLVVMPHRVAYQHQLLELEGVQYDLGEMPPVGSPIIDTGVFVVHERTGITDIEQLRGGGESVIVGASPPPTEGVLMRDYLGVNIDLIPAYQSGDALNLALEQGEIDGRLTWSISSIVSFDQSVVEQMNMLVQHAVAPHPLVPEEVPLLIDLAEDDDTRDLIRLVFASGQLGRPLFLPPNVPDDRVAALRQAFDEMMEDPEFLADADSREMEIMPVSGQELEELIEQLLNTPAEIVALLEEVNAAEG